MTKDKQELLPTCREQFDKWFIEYMGLHPETDTCNIDYAYYPYKAWVAANKLYTRHHPEPTEKMLAELNNNTAVGLLKFIKSSIQEEELSEVTELSIEHSRLVYIEQEINRMLQAARVQRGEG